MDLLVSDARVRFFVKNNGFNSFVVLFPLLGATIWVIANERLAKGLPEEGYSFGDAHEEYIGRALLELHKQDESNVVYRSQSAQRGEPKKTSFARENAGRLSLQHLSRPLYDHDSTLMEKWSYYKETLIKLNVEKRQIADRLNVAKSQLKSLETLSI
ncbi:hypothetical protein QR680_011534 [Steinernema hermaphroditum]|uniref:Uncharacterized protein n=1 Tax=Steinernema hermaphroditum TaxID=289476 RepID=A0AA39HYT5_9BILA|nr:hypothetical protein QR680_011534 [Steinernema hermaphroditum]